MEDAGSTYDLSQLSPYERQAWDGVQRWRREQENRRSLVPAPIRQRGKQVGQGATKALHGTPGTAQLTEIVNKVPRSLGR